MNTISPHAGKLPILQKRFDTASFMPYFQLWKAVYPRIRAEESLVMGG
ncbi:hypothetical protein ABK905_10965 [Acerihabitans sp. KWT182]|uniref:Uncharacterized protein n=1 Tax=Acerihabitans sp. KWT182 TaxID=3157919 RepID=A0AAU7QE37_9GAMM